MTQQVTRKDIGNVFRPQSRLFQRQPYGLFLEGALRLLPGLAAEHVVPAYLVEQQAQGALPLLGAHYAGAV